MSADVGSDVLEKHLDALEKMFTAALGIAVLVAWAGLQREDTFEIVSLKVTRDQALFVAAVTYVVFNLALLLTFLRIHDVVSTTSTDHMPPLVETLRFHSWLLNPFADFGSSRLATIHSSAGTGLLIFVWWIANGSLHFLDDGQRYALILRGLFLLVGIATLRVITMTARLLDSGPEYVRWRFRWIVAGAILGGGITLISGCEGKPSQSNVPTTRSFATAVFAPPAISIGRSREEKVAGYVEILTRLYVLGRVAGESEGSTGGSPRSTTYAGSITKSAASALSSASAGRTAVTSDIPLLTPWRRRSAVPHTIPLVISVGVASATESSALKRKTASGAEREQFLKQERLLADITENALTDARRTCGLVIDAPTLAAARMKLKSLLLEHAQMRHPGSTPIEIHNLTWQALQAVGAVTTLDIAAVAELQHGFGEIAMDPGEDAAVLRGKVDAALQTAEKWQSSEVFQHLDTRLQRRIRLNLEVIRKSLMLHDSLFS